MFDLGLVWDDGIGLGEGYCDGGHPSWFGYFRCGCVVIVAETSPRLFRKFDPTEVYPDGQPMFAPENDMVVLYSPLCTAGHERPALW